MPRVDDVKSAFDIKLGTTLEEVAHNAVSEAKRRGRPIFIHYYGGKYYGDTMPVETSILYVPPRSTVPRVMQKLRRKGGFDLTVGNRVVGHSLTRTAAHRASRSQRHLGASVNRAGKKASERRARLMQGFAEDLARAEAAKRAGYKFGMHGESIDDDIVRLRRAVASLA